MNPSAGTDLPVAIAMTHALLPSLKRKGFHHYPTAQPATQTLEINTLINLSSLILDVLKNIQLSELQYRKVLLLGV